LDIELPPSDVEEPRSAEQVNDDYNVAPMFFDFQRVTVVRYRREVMRFARYIDAYQPKQVLAVSVPGKTREYAGWYSVHNNFN